jgi:hypothetical protein
MRLSLGGYTNRTITAVIPFAHVDLAGIRTWDELDSRWATALDFPGWYGHNRDAWLDVMSSLDEIGMVGTPFEGKGAILIEVSGADDVAQHSPEVLRELIELTAAANARYKHSLSGHGVALVFTESASG